MYVCMLLTNWKTLTKEGGDNHVAVDTGEGSVWVKV